MDDLEVYANQWRIGLNTGKTSKLLFQRSTQYIPDWHITLHRKAIPSVTSAKFLGITFDTTLSFTKHFHTVTNLARHRLLKLLSISTSIHGPLPSTTIRLFNIYIRTLLEYGGAATCVANPSRFVQWERLQTQLITKTLDLPNTLNHDLLRQHADQPTIHDRLLYLAKRWYGKAYENNAAHRDFFFYFFIFLCKSPLTRLKSHCNVRGYKLLLQQKLIDPPLECCEIVICWKAFIGEGVPNGCGSRKKGV